MPRMRAGGGGARGRRGTASFGRFANAAVNHERGKATAVRGRRGEEAGMREQRETTRKEEAAKAPHLSTEQHVVTPVSE